jgi:hypothetical protein
MNFRFLRQKKPPLSTGRDGLHSFTPHHFGVRCRCFSAILHKSNRDVMRSP